MDGPLTKTLQLMLQEQQNLERIAVMERFTVAEVQQALQSVDAGTAEEFCLQIMLRYALPEAVD